MKPRWRATSALFTLGVVSLWSAIAAASPASPHGGPDSEPPTHGDPHGAGIEWVTPVFGNTGKVGLLWILINFAVLLWLLEKLLFSKLRARQAEKHDTIKHNVDKATEARTEAEGLVAEYRARLERLDGEIEELLADAKRKADADRAAIIAAAQAEAERIKTAATAAAEREAESRRKQIENEIVDRAIERAEAALRAQLNPMDQRRMVDDYIGRLGQVALTGQSSSQAPTSNPTGGAQ